MFSTPDIFKTNENKVLISVPVTNFKFKEDLELVINAIPSRRQIFKTSFSDDVDYNNWEFEITDISDLIFVKLEKLFQLNCSKTEFLEQKNI